MYSTPNCDARGCYDHSKKYCEYAKPVGVLLNEKNSLTTSPLFDSRNALLDSHNGCRTTTHNFCKQIKAYQDMILNLPRKPLSCVIFAMLYFLSTNAQEADSTRSRLDFSGQLSVTNNGFSLVPTFTLGDPAVVSTFYIGGKGRFSFEPQFRYALDFKPWSFIFIWRYKLIRKEKFEIKIGTHLPALSFRTIEATHEGEEKSVVQARRFFPVAELLPVWKLTPKLNIGIYYLYGKGIESDLNDNTHFISLQGGYKQLPLFGNWHLSANAQLYYLRLDDLDGVYLAPSVSLGKTGVPFSISSAMNKAISTDIAGEDFEWNVSLNWTFGNRFVQSQ